MTPETEQQYKNQIAELQAEIEKLKNQQTKAIKREKYGLNWIDVPEEFDEKSKNSIPVLKEIKEKAIKNTDGKPTHILIEGDNYHALTCLNYTHAGKIDVIYIDPPYNTGSDGFTYKDARFMTEFPNGKTVPKDDPLRHSTWLSFMDKRLRLAKNLLSDKGVIFISIDDNEQANLKLLCDQIFGEKNFVGEVITISNPGGRDYDQIAVMHEYILIYGCNKLNELPKVVEFKYFDDKGGYDLRELRNRNPKFTRKNRPNLFYPFYINPNLIDEYNCCSVSLEKKESHFIEVVPLNSKGIESVWRWGKEKSTTNNNEIIQKSEIVAKQKKDGNWNIYEKCRKDTSKPKSVWNETEMRTEDGTRLIMSMFAENIFDHPKSIALINRCLQIASSPSSTILDFFAGSGTTLHATMKLNAEDGGNRQCILVQQQENDSNICETITYERNRRVMQGYTNAKGEEIAGLGNSLKYYKTDFIGENDAEKAGDEDKITLAQKAGYLISLVENTLEEIETNDFYQIFSDAKENQFTAIYFNGDTEKFPDFVQSIQEKNKKTIVYIFTWGSPDIFENEFDDLSNITIKSIPQPILEIYKSLMKNEE